MENDLYALPPMALMDIALLLLGIGIFSGILIPLTYRFHVKRRSEREWRAAKEHLPNVTLRKREAHWRGGVTALMPQIASDILNSDGRCVGRITYVLSPIADCVYLYGIDVGTEFQSRGYGTATLLELSQSNGGLPITPIQEANFSFWKRIHKLADQGFPVNEQISIGDWKAESRKWAHLHFHERFFTHVRTHHAKTLVDFQKGEFPMATGVEEIRDPDFLKGFQPRQ